MKLFLALTLLMSSVSFAQSVTITDEKLLAPYKEATVSELYRTDKVYCKFRENYKMWAVARLVEDAKTLTVSDGQQPLLIFISERKLGFMSVFPDIVQVRVTITTTPDFKEITSILIQADHQTRKNIGDLKNPKFVDTVEVNPVLTCRK